MGLQVRLPGTLSEQGTDIRHARQNDRGILPGHSEVSKEGAPLCGAVVDLACSACVPLPGY